MRFLAEVAGQRAVVLEGQLSISLIEEAIAVVIPGKTAAPISTVSSRVAVVVLAQN